MRIIKCEVCWKEMEVKFWVKKYCLECRKKKDDEFSKKYYEKEKLEKEKQKRVE